LTIYIDDAHRPVAGQQYIPLSMEARGTIVPRPPLTGMRNGIGMQVAAGLASFDWTFDYINQTEFDFWTGIVGYNPATFTYTYSKIWDTKALTGVLPAARVWETSTRIVNYTHCVIDLPTWSRFENNIYFGVNIHFSRLVPG
jgi:hypothetical protein